MNPEELEKLLPRYLDGDLTAQEKARVEAFLESSGEARASLETYRALERALRKRSDQVPPVDRIISAALARVTPRRARIIMDKIFSFPVLSSSLVTILGVVLFLYREPITKLTTGYANLPDSKSLGLDWVGRAIVQFAGGDMWMLTAMYAAITILILLSTSLMVMRFLRG